MDQGSVADTLEIEGSDLSEVLFEVSPDCVMLIAPDGRLARMNARGQEALEIVDFDQYVGAPWAELWPIASRREVREAVGRARAGETAHFQAFCPTARGTPKWWDVSLAPVHAEGGRLSVLLAICREVKEAAATGQALITVVDGGIISGWSPEAHAMFGWSADEAIGQRMEMIAPESQRELSRAWFDSLLAARNIENLGCALRGPAIRRTG